MSYDARWLVAVTVQALRRMPATPLKAIARGCGVSRHTLTRALRAETALSYREWQRVCRRERAEAIFGEQPAISIKEGAYELGFAAPRSFSRWLKHTLGCTPRGFRSRIRARAVEAAGDPRSMPRA